MRDEMTIKELKALLAKYNDDDAVYIEGGVEGSNEFAMLKVFNGRNTETVMGYNDDLDNRVTPW